ncbi:MAG: 50S ribosomal protein L1 [Verrucomicrobia bacterium GWF2_51_19]|nr:MAG: 50S ribosomal protein L1 [Verrucomicrobia bacterium GWF2_51_19]HCJ12562.1 50S ribosomal protein L1 [Opitutae bacterium]
MAQKPSKRYREAIKHVESDKAYSLTEAVALLNEFPKAKFDETVEISAHLGVDPKQSTHMVRGTVSLPHGSGKKIRVLVFTEDPEAAIKAGADFAGLADMIQKVQEGWMDFDVALSTTTAMKEVRNVARVLGPRGLMPNPKSGTVTDDIAAGVHAVKAGRVEFKMDKTGNVSVIIGKRSFTPEALMENAKQAIDIMGKARPESLKGKYICSMTLTATMSPGIPLDSKEFGHY